MKGLFKLRNVSYLDRWCNSLGLAIAVAFPLFSVTSALSIRASRQPQYLPATAAVMLSDGKLIELEVARTEEQQAKGLMYRPPLTPNRGMLFPVTPPRKVVLWTKSMQQSIDVLFVYRGKVVGILSQLPPCKSSCPTYGVDITVDNVIELPSGFVSLAGLSKGASLNIRLEENASPSSEQPSVKRLND